MHRFIIPLICLFTVCGTDPAFAQRKPTERQLAKWLKQFPQADANKDGKLTNEEVSAYRQKFRNVLQRGVPRKFNVDPGWDKDRFPEQAICYKTPEEIKNVYAKVVKGKNRSVTTYEKPTDGSLRIVATGHSFMAPGFKTLPQITKAAALKQPPLLTHTGGGMTGSARYKWEQENGIFQFDGKPVPRLLSSIANAKWDAMMWGPYYNDRPAYYSCWIDFCLKYNPDMKFFVADAWPQLEQFKPEPTKESALTYEAIAKLGAEKNATSSKTVEQLNKKYNGRIFVMPTSDAMVLAVREYHKGNLPGIEGIHKSLGRKERSLWRDHLGHLGPGLDVLEGYVFYSTLYRRSPELIKDDIRQFNANSFPGKELDSVFRKIAWEAVVNHPHSGVKDANKDGLGD